jgi:hypothetical protein
MFFGRRLLATFLALAGAMMATGAWAYEPQDVVRALYTEPSVSMEPIRSAGYFARDLDGALKSGGSGFDFRYSAQGMQIRGLELVADIDHDQARVVAVFKSSGKANSVDWTLCRRPNGDWRITNAASNTGAQAWDLRQMLSLPETVVRC